LLAPGFLTGKEIEAFQAAIDWICSGAVVAHHDSDRLEMEPGQALEGNRVRRIYEPSSYYPEFRALSECPKLPDCVAKLLGDNLLFHYSKINMKPPAIGSPVSGTRIWLTTRSRTRIHLQCCFIWMKPTEGTADCKRLPEFIKLGFWIIAGRGFLRPDYGATG
jgi:hypothetical protein